MPAIAAERHVIPRLRAVGGKEIWLTFDDGPHPARTKKVLSVLAKHGIKATFFMIGQNCRLNPGTIKLVADAGHRIGNHSYTHPQLTKLSRARIREEIVKTEALIAPFMHGKKLFRPPYGAHNALVDEVVAELGYRLVIWNVDTLDWSADFKPDKWVQHGINQIKARQNSVVLNHDIQRTTGLNLDLFIQKIKAISGAKFQPPASL
jgi:peptidoglycan-N-acetylglucosamine deacetylase